MKWRKANTIVGSVASGTNYFPREKTERRLWNQIERGNYILFTAPRRFGKSSIMKYLAKNHGTSYLCEYENISSDASTADFYKRLFNLALKVIDADVKFKTKLRSFINQIGIEAIGPDGVKFKKGNINHKSLLLQLLPELKKAKIKIVLFVDEFPDVIRNIHNKEGKEAALDVLQTLRSLRHNEDFAGHLTLVFSGSVGLDHVVKNIDRTAVINDLNFQYLEALKDGEPKAFIQHLTQKASMKISEEVSQYLLDKLNYPMPYYIQLIVEHCDERLHDEERTTLTKDDVDHSWDEILQEARYFSDWDERLQDYFPKEYQFFRDVLQKCAHQNRISLQEVFDIAGNHQLAHQFKGLIDDVLLKDGYLFNQGSTYAFHSPLLKEWWANRYPLV